MRKEEYLPKKHVIIHLLIVATFIAINTYLDMRHRDDPNAHTSEARKW